MTVKRRVRPQRSLTSRYDRLHRLLEGERLPCALVDLDAVDFNIDQLLRPLAARGKGLRVASKSIRCVELLRHVVHAGGEQVRGVMGFSVEEAAFLVERGFDDVLVAYPSVQSSDSALLAELNAREVRVSIIVDSELQVQRLGAAGVERGSEIPLVVELDLSYRPLRGAVHLGVRRSPLRTAQSVVELARHIESQPGVAFWGVMGYEAHVAGMGDANPFTRAMNPLKKLVKRLSLGPIEKERATVARLLRECGIELHLFNGGGTGSIFTTSAEDAVTEVTVGSGFVCSHLFDYYESLALRPALLFVLQVVRNSDPDYVTCHGGGYVASGEPGLDRLPLPYLPPGLRLTRFEAAGEVQTPLRLPPGRSLAPGDPVFFRHSKAGELAERFNEYLLVRGDEIVARVPTYRGEGMCFL